MIPGGAGGLNDHPRRVIVDRAADDQLVDTRRGDEIGEPRKYRPGRAHERAGLESIYLLLDRRRQRRDARPRRTERITEAAGIAHEVETYNELLGGPGELGATLLIEIDNPAVRAVKLGAWLELPRHVYARFAAGTRVSPTFDARQVGTERVSPVQYLKFPLRGRVPVALGIDLPAIATETELTPEQHRALEADLASDR